MSDLEEVSQHEPAATPVLIKAALAHAQFETIHPFQDGNGRVGRLLITLLLCSQGVLTTISNAYAPKGRGAATAHRVHDLATRYVVIRPAATARTLRLTDPPVYGAIGRLEEAGILREVTGRLRGKIYVYDQYLALLNEGTEAHVR